MTKTYYHATPYENLISILDNGLLPGSDGLVYLTDKPEDALKFMKLRFLQEVLIVEVDLEEDLVEESFDHNERFFKCKAYCYRDTVSPDDIREIYKYKL